MDFDEGFLQRYAGECAKAGVEPLSPAEAVKLALAVILTRGIAETGDQHDDDALH